VKDLYYYFLFVFVAIFPKLEWLWEGPSAYVPGIDGRKIFDQLTASGFRGPSNFYAELAVPATTDALRALCLCIAVLAAMGMLFNRFFRDARLPAAVVKGLYALAFVTLCAAPLALRSRLEPEAYAASLPLRATLSTAPRPSSAPSSETISPGLTVNYECSFGACGLRAGHGCSAYPNEPFFDKVMLRRDEQRGWWVFDTGVAQLVFRDGDFACVMPQYVHVMSSVRPSTGMYVLAVTLLAGATVMLFASRRASRRKESRSARFRDFAVILLSAWALYPLLPALLTSLS
jgi:hypothetical protein